MLNLTLNKLRLIVKKLNIDDYKSMSRNLTLPTPRQAFKLKNI